MGKMYLSGVTVFKCSHSAKVNTFERDFTNPYKPLEISDHKHHGCS